MLPSGVQVTVTVNAVVLTSGEPPYSVTRTYNVEGSDESDGGAEKKVASQKSMVALTGSVTLPTGVADTVSVCVCVVSAADDNVRPKNT